MDTMRAMRSFVRAAELGSLSAAAREQQTTQPTISKMVSALERSLGVRLLERTTTSLRMTDQGRRFHERARRLLDEYAEAVADTRGHTDRPTGLLRVAASAAFGQLRVNRMLLDFQTLCPDVQIDLSLADRAVDLVEENFDLAVRIGGPLPAQGVAPASGCLEAVLRCLTRVPETSAASARTTGLGLS